jgi:hypothetical protein
MSILYNLKISIQLYLIPNLPDDGRIKPRSKRVVNVAWNYSYELTLTLTPSPLAASNSATSKDKQELVIAAWQSNVSSL